MATYLTDDAICLRVTDFSETSQIVTLFTRRHGLVPLIAKGAKRQSQKNTMSGPLDLLTGGEVVFVPAKNAATGAELSTLAGWELLNQRTLLRANLAAWSAGMLCDELTTLLVHPHDPHEQLFLELDATLELLPTAQRTRAIVAYAKASLLAAGYAPHLSSCIACNKSLTTDTTLRFSPRLGGVLCCPPSAPTANRAPEGPTHPVSARVILALDRLPSPIALRAAPPDRPADSAALATAIELLLAQIESITNKPIKTRNLLPAIFSPLAC